MLKKQLQKLPTLAGIYKFKNNQGNILYIGKAKNLKNRVRSYFTAKAELSPAKRLMVSQISKIEYTVVTNETEAQLLESSLIKKHQPPYNIDLKDDKSWLYIKLYLENNLPKISTVRKLFKDKAKYLGPYTSAQAVRRTVRLLKKIFPQLSFDKKLQKYRLQKDQWNLASQTKNASQDVLKQVTAFLNGQNAQVLKNLKKRMSVLSGKKQYEKASIVRDQIESIQRISEYQKVIFTQKESQDLISLFKSPAEYDLAIVNLFKIREGKLLNQQNFTLKNVKFYSDKELLEQFINQYYSQTDDFPKKLILPFELNFEIEKIKKVLVPSKGKKKKLLEMGKTNAKQFFLMQQTSWQKDSKSALSGSASGGENLKKLQLLLKLEKLPHRIEAYDISNIQGKLATGSMVVFINGQPAKNEYRRFTIKTVTGPNDPAMIAEIIKRRFTHNNWPMPDLILIDGGQGQLNAACKQCHDLPIISLAKRQEEIYYKTGSKPLQLPLNSPVLQLLQRLRDEAHRFAISGHRIKQQKSLKLSQLDEIPGIGPKTKKLLIKKLGSLTKIKDAKNNELIDLIGKHKTKILKSSLT
ncbi:excinuclease ABC subunit UvrC [Patescibacteria group bacterium]|nr:excinuclease ABC subunit UvrC [Patescibacteria group bacterium]